MLVFVPWTFSQFAQRKHRWCFERFCAICHLVLTFLDVRNIPKSIWATSFISKVLGSFRFNRGILNSRTVLVTSIYCTIATKTPTAPWPLHCNKRFLSFKVFVPIYQPFFLNPFGPPNLEGWLKSDFLELLLLPSITGWLHFSGRICMLFGTDHRASSCGYLTQFRCLAGKQRVSWGDYFMRLWNAKSLPTPGIGWFLLRD